MKLNEDHQRSSPKIMLFKWPTGLGSTEDLYIKSPSAIYYFYKDGDRTIRAFFIKRSISEAWRALYSLSSYPGVTHMAYCLPA